MALRRLQYFASHLAISATIIGAVVAFIILVWYPPPLAQLEGVYSILLVMAAVDVCAGPLCTLVAASPNKPRSELKRDLAIIGSVQLIALGYAVYTTCVARPAFIVYNSGAFDIEHANELTADQLAKASAPNFSRAPLDGPAYVAAPMPEDPAEAARIIQSAVLTGVDIKDMPRYYKRWPDAGSDAAYKAVPVDDLPARRPLRDAVARVLANKGGAVTDAIVLPINGKLDRGTVVLRKSDLAVLGIVPILAPPTKIVPVPAPAPKDGVAEKERAAPKNGAKS